MQTVRNTQPRLVIKAKGSFYFLMLPLPIVIVPAGIGLIENGNTQTGWLMLLLSLFFIVPAAVGIYLSIVPSYVIDSDGIKVRNVGLLRWTEIALIDLVTVNGFTLLGVTIQNKVLPKKNGFWQRLNPKAKAWPHRDLYLPLFLVSSSPQQILETICAYKEVVQGEAA